MDEEKTIPERMHKLSCCVIIPTYNNAATLESVVEGVLHYCHNVIVVNDGSTDDTGNVLNELTKLTKLTKLPDPVTDHASRITVITMPHNKGKGLALREGFAYAIEQGYRYAITLDSDGQHDPREIPLFLDKIGANPDALVIGARNMNQEGVPGTSSFGHRFSIFWFRVETGLKTDDVQSGYRLYPLHHIREIRHLYSTKYEFEVEVMVRLAWRGVPVVSVPINVYYAPKGERVSHFRKGPDFARTSLLNAILVFAALLWVRPFHLARKLRGKSFKQIIRDYIVNSQDSNGKLAWSLTLGLFIGVSPFWGWQMMAAVGLAHLLKLNKFVALIASNISIPPLIPFILFISYLTGGIVLGNDTDDFSYSSSISLKWVKQNLIQYAVGSVVFGALFAPLAGLISYLVLSVVRRKGKPGELSNP